MDNNIRMCFLTASEAYYQQFREKDYHELSKDLFIQKPIELEELLKKSTDMIEIISSNLDFGIIIILCVKLQYSLLLPTPQ